MPPHRTSHKSQRAHRRDSLLRSVRESAANALIGGELLAMRQVLYVFMPDQPAPPRLTMSARVAIPPVDLANPIDESLADRIARLASQWRKETGHLSSIERKVINPAYQAIIATGRRGVPYVLREMKERGGHWFWALHFMTGVDFGDVQSVEDLRNMWLMWGREQGYAGL